MNIFGILYHKVVFFFILSPFFFTFLFEKDFFGGLYPIFCE